MAKINLSKRTFSSSRERTKKTSIHGIYDTPQKGIQASKRRIGRLMSVAGLCGGSKARTRVSTTHADGSSVASDLVQRQFRARRPNQLWVADAKYIDTHEGTLYLAIVKDVYSRKIVGSAMSPQQTVHLMLQALVHAVDQRRPPVGLIHHSDHGSQYTANRFREFCTAAGIKQSMGSVGDCYDNAMAETFFATLQKELINRQPRKHFGTREEAKMKIFQYIESFYNQRRPHSALGNRSPAEFERVYDQKADMET